MSLNVAQCRPSRSLCCLCWRLASAAGDLHIRNLQPGWPIANWTTGIGDGQGSVLHFVSYVWSSFLARDGAQGGPGFTIPVTVPGPVMTGQATEHGAKVGREKRQGVVQQTQRGPEKTQKMPFCAVPSKKKTIRRQVQTEAV